MEVTIEQVKQAVEDQGKANDARLKVFETQIAEAKKLGEASGESKEVLAKVVKDLADLEAVKAIPEKLKLIEAAIKRSGALDKDGNEKPSDLAEAKASFSDFLRHDDSQHSLPSSSGASWRYAKHNPRMNVKSLSVQSDPDGGYMVLSDLSGRVVKRIFETSDMRAICNVQTIGTDALEGIYDDNEATNGGWVGETASRSSSATPQIGKWAIPAHEQYCYPFTTQKMLDDANVDIEAWLAEKIADNMGRTENTAFVLGSGVNQPKGIMSFASGTTLRSTIERVNTGATTGATYAGLVNVMKALKSGYRARARWGMGRPMIAAMMGILDGQNRPLWQPSMQAGIPSLLFGYPISELNDIVTPTSASLSLAFGDFQQAYQIVDRIGLRILRNPFATLGSVGFYTTKRTGGSVINTEAIKIGVCSV